MQDNFPWNELDSVLDGLTCKDIITATVCNEPDATNPEVIERVFKELLASRLVDARHMFNEYKKEIVKEIKSRKREG